MPGFAASSAQTLSLAIALLVFLAGCGGLSRETSKTQRTAVEQLLLSQAVQRSLADVSLPLPRGASLWVDSFGLTPDQEYVRHATEEQLAKLGYRVVPKDDKPPYLVRIVLQALGTEQGATFFGMPPVQSVVIPFSLPEISLYKKVQQRAHVRLALHLYPLDGHRLLSFTPWLSAITHYDQYTILLLFGFTSTDLRIPRDRLVGE